MSDPNDLRPRAAWAEVLVFGEGCPSEEDLASGVYPQPLQRQSFEAMQPFPGSLPVPTGSHGVAALLRQEDCGIIGFGCVKVEIPKTSQVNVRINPTYLDEQGNLLPLGQCEGGQICVEGGCSLEGAGGAAGGAAGAAGAAGGSGGAGGTGGAVGECKDGSGGPPGCSLELLGWGALPAPAPGAKMGSPAVLATGSGFVVGYGELSADGSKRVVRLTPTTPDGCGQQSSESLFEECKATALAGFEPSLGGIWREDLGQGLVGFRRTPCPDEGRGMGFGLVNLDGSGKILDSGVIDNSDPDVPVISFASKNALSAGLNDEPFRVIYVQAGVSQSFSLQGVGSSASQVDNFFEDVPNGPLTGLIFALQARSGPLAVQAASGQGGGKPQTGVRVTNGGAVSYVLRPESREMALQLQDGQIVLASRSPQDVIGWALLDGKGSQLFPAAAVQDAPVETSAGGFDLATAKDRALLVVGRAGGFKLHAFSKLSSGTPAQDPGSEVSAAQVPALAGFDGRQIAAAAGAGRVAVAWTNPSAAGGFAVFRCE